MVNIPGLLRAKRKRQFEVVEFVPVERVFKPQSEIKMLKDVTGWVNRDKRTGKKWHFNTGKTYYVDAELADEFIIKGYARGSLSRYYSDDEAEQIKAGVQHISMPTGA